MFHVVLNIGETLCHALEAEICIALFDALHNSEFRAHNLLETHCGIGKNFDQSLENWFDDILEENLLISDDVRRGGIHPQLGLVIHFLFSNTLRIELLQVRDRIRFVTEAVHEERFSSGSGLKYLTSRIQQYFKGVLTFDTRMAT